MKNKIGFFNIEENDNGDIIWNGFLVEKVGGNKLKINEKIYDITPGFQKVLTDTSNIPMTKINYNDREVFTNILESLDVDKYKAIRGESESGRYKHSTTNFKKRTLKGQGIEKLSYHLTYLNITPSLKPN